MNQGLIVGVIIVVVAVAVYFFWRLKEKAKAGRAWTKGTEERAHKLLATPPTLTADQHEVYFEPGQDKAAFPMSAVDLGVDACYDRAECEYPVDRSAHRERICVLDGEPDMDGNPAFKVKIAHNNPYYNSEWDKCKGQGMDVDHYVLVAGQLIAVGEPFGDVIAIPYHDANHAAHCQTIVDYEFEHSILSWHDGPKFEVTKIHSNGQGHPLIAGTCLPQARGLVSRASYKCDGSLMLTK